MYSALLHSSTRKIRALEMPLNFDFVTTLGEVVVRPPCLLLLKPCMNLQTPASPTVNV